MMSYPVAARAAGRAEELLFTMLTEEQRQDYYTKQYIVVIGSDGNKYRIYNSGMVGQHCVYPYCINREGDIVKDPLPPGDIVLWAKLWLEANAELFWGIADRNVYLANSGAIVDY